MTPVPPRFLFRVAYSCLYVREMPAEEEDSVLDLPPACRIDNFAAMEGQRNFADVRLAWNEMGLGMQVEVKGKDNPPRGDAARPRVSDGITLWIDTRDARTSHRASRYCHQFHLLATGGGEDKEEPVFVQSKIHRALADAPMCDPNAVPFRSDRILGGYRIEAFFPAAVLHGFDPEQNPRLGIFYAVRDADLGEQLLGAGPDFPFPEDPSLWSVLELARDSG